MRSLVPLAVTALALTLTACASGTVACKADDSYLRAESVRSPQSTTGLVVTENPAALRIPDVQATSAAPSATRNHRTACMEFPPALPNAEAPAPAAP